MANSQQVPPVGNAHHVATATLTVALRRKDNTPSTTPADCAAFAQLLAAVLDQDSPTNVEACKRWVLQHVTASPARIDAFGRYLVAFSKATTKDQSSKKEHKKAVRNRLDILFVVSDVLHADKFHNASSAPVGAFGLHLPIHIKDLTNLAASLMSDTGSKYEQQIKDMLRFWELNGLLLTNDISTIQRTTLEALAKAQGSQLPKSNNAVEYTLPTCFGGESTPWHDLPASHMLEAMICNPGAPIRSQDIKVKRFAKREPSEYVKGLLDEYFENIDLKYTPTGDNPTGETNKHNLWLDSMGQLVKQDKQSGKISTVSNGYGWSPQLCQDMVNHGVPTNIKQAREDYRKEKEQREQRRAGLNSRWDTSAPPPKRPRSPSFASDTDREQDYPNTRRRRDSNSSYDSHDYRPHRRDSRDGSCGPGSRPSSREGDSNRNSRPSSSEGPYNSRPRRSSRDDGDRHEYGSRRYNDDYRYDNSSRSYNNDENSFDRHPLPPQNHRRSNNNSNHNRGGYPVSSIGSNLSSGDGQVYSRAPHPQNNMPPFVPPPPPGQPSSQFPMPQGFQPPPPPPPFQPGPGGYMGGTYGQPTFNGPFPNAFPGAGAFPNHQSGNNRTGYGNNVGYGGNNRGSYRGSFGGSFQGRNRGGFNPNRGGNQFGGHGGNRR